MFTSAPCVYSVNYQARCISALKGSNESHQFLVGTCSTKEKNELSVLKYDEENNQIDAKTIYSHPDQILAMEPSPTDRSLVVTSSQRRDGTRDVSLFKLSGETGDGNLDDDKNQSYHNELKDLDRVTRFSFQNDQNFVQSIKWHSSKDTILTLDALNLGIWSLREADISSTGVVHINSSENYEPDDFVGGNIAWDPHNSNVCVAVSDSNFHLIDTRKQHISLTVPNLHHGSIRDVDFNPNKPMTIVTCGDDRKLKIWDIRSLKTPLTTLEGHTHWVWSCKYNPFHDQLIISGGSDNLVNLWRIASSSSAPWLGMTSTGEPDDDEDEGYTPTDTSDPPDVKVKAMDQHEECVYGVAWSPAEAWMYCSLSYEGRVILNHVPSTEKYKILL